MANVPIKKNQRSFADRLTLPNGNLKHYRIASTLFTPSHEPTDQSAQLVKYLTLTLSKFLLNFNCSYSYYIRVGFLATQRNKGTKKCSQVEGGGVIMECRQDEIASIIFQKFNLTVFSVIGLTGTCVLLKFAEPNLFHNHDWWAILLLIIFGLVSTGSLISIARQPQSSGKLSFKVNFWNF